MKLDIQNLSVSYDADVVLKELSLTVNEGEFVSLLGPSGCGKSTLLKTIAGILPAARGSICLGGTDITRLPVHRRGTVVVFQDMRLFPHMTILDNVAFPLKMQGVPKAERLETAARLLEKVQLGGYGTRKPAELSGGQQQRVALARALAAKPHLLLLDEPFSALDENLREEMRLLVKQLHRDFGMTTILVTHDREEALSMSDRVAMMFGGSIHQFDTPETVYHRPASRAAANYFGDCLYLPGSVTGGLFRAGSLTLDTGLPDGEYDLLLRPGDLRLGETGSYPLSVEALSFRGSDTLVTLRGSEGLLWKKAVTGAVSLKIGDRIHGVIEPGHRVLFPRNHPVSR